MAERGVIFKEAPILSPKRSWFDLSNENLLSLNFGKIVPTMCMECLPGDHIKLKTYAFGRVYPTLAPTFGKVNLFTYQFFVRSRDIWTDFDKFITNNDQKKTWQQNESFVAPAMPTFNPIYLMYGGPFAALSESQSTAVSANTCYALEILKKSGTSYVTIWNGQGAHDRVRVESEDPYYPRIVFFFKPKLSEFVHEKTISVGSESFENIMALDLFSEGTLSDYLGIDYSGFYKTTQWVFWNKMVNAFSGISGVDLFDYMDTVFTGTLSPIVGPNTLDFGITTLEQVFEFLKTHAVVGIWFSNGTNNYAPRVLCGDGTGVAGIAGETFTTQTPLYGSSIEIGNLCELPLRAYRFIYDEYFRDQNYIQVNPNTDFSANGSHNSASAQSVLTSWWFARYFSLENKAWEHDPYTTALPSPQRGDAVRFLTDANVNFIGNHVTLGKSFGGTASASKSGFKTDSNGIIRDSNNDVLNIDNTEALSVDLSQATVENFRWASSMQKYLEKKARTGGRYYEYLVGIWDKYVEDAKLNRPIYLNGEKIPLQISEVLQTSKSDFDTAQPLGDMAGRGIMVGSADFLEYECPDYGYLVEVVCVVPRVGYMQGLAPMFTRENYLDFPLPDFAQLGEEYVKQSELYYSANPSEDDKAFGYQSRYYQWKYRRDEAHSDFKNSLDFWHWYRKFDSAPVNGQKFLEVDPDYRQFAVTSKNFNHVYLSVEHDMQVNRALPEFGVPVL